MTTENTRAGALTVLLPCPFCGGEPKRITLNDEANFGGDAIVCRKCDCSSHVEFGEKSGLVDAWNSRPGPRKLLPASITVQSALAAIETFEIVGENSDSREPNADDRYILTEFIAHAFGGYPVGQREAARASAATQSLSIEDVRAAKETARQLFAGDCNHTLDAIEYVTSLLEATDATRSRAASGASQAVVHVGTEPVALTAATHDVLAERRRQVEAEGWTPEHDDQYQHGSIAQAAGCYALHASGVYHGMFPAPAVWPWMPKWWKPTTPRRDLVKAGALILAEIERLDRAGEAQ